MCGDPSSTLRELPVQPGRAPLYLLFRLLSSARLLFGKNPYAASHLLCRIWARFPHRLLLLTWVKWPSANRSKFSSRVMQLLVLLSKRGRGDWCFVNKSTQAQIPTQRNIQYNLWHLIMLNCISSNSLWQFPLSKWKSWYFYIFCLQKIRWVCVQPSSIYLIICLTG